jgi:hypothetical protein
MNQRQKAEPKPLYVYRPVKNAAKIISWFKGQGLKTTLPPEEMHVTLIYSRKAVDWMQMGDPMMYGPPGDASDLVVPEGGPRMMDALGPEKKATVLLFTSDPLKWRHDQFLRNGAASDYPNFQPHITITYERPDDLPLAKIEPYKGEIIFGPECFEDINDDYRSTLMEKAGARHSAGDRDMIQQMHDHSVKLGAECAYSKAALPAAVIKVDEEQHMVYGWASVVTEKGQPVIDLQDDVIMPDTMAKAATEFMLDVRKALVMHARNPSGGIDDDMIKGIVVHSLPLTVDLAKSLGIHTEREGWIVGMKIQDPTTWQLVKEGKLKAFSIGGSSDRVKMEDAA